MAKIVGIGACVMDTLFQIPFYPKEDTKLRAEDSCPAGGGPTATGLVAAQKLGVCTAYIGNLAQDGGGAFLKADFERFGVSTAYLTELSGYRSFTSVIWLSKDTAGRTCVFDRGNLPPLALNDAQKQAIRDAQILMVDGNDLAAAVEGAKIAHQSNTAVLYDCGGLYDGVERLLCETDIMIPSEEFAMGHTGEKTALAAAKKLFAQYHPKVVVVTQGKAGGILYDGKTAQSYPAFPVSAVDTNGAGDVFHGAFAAGLCRGYSYETCCLFASAVSALKCTGTGARDSVPDFETVKQFLKENGYEL